MIISKQIISIILPVFNVETYIDECLKSIVNQSYFNLEIIIVNDGSTDSSTSKCKQWASKDNRIILIEKKNGGLSSARNAGLDLASGEFIMFVDSDDVLDKDFCLKMISQLNDTPSCDIVACGIAKFEDPDISKSKAFFPYISKTVDTKDFWKHILTHQCDNAVWGKIFKREVIINNRFRTGIINEDIVFYVDITQNMKKIKFIDEPLYFYRVRAGSITTQINPKLSDFFYNSLEVKNKIGKIKEWGLHNEAYGFLLTEITNIISTIEKFNAKKSYITLYEEMLYIIKNNVIRSFKNQYWPITKKLKFLLIIFIPSLYRYLLKAK